MNPIEVRIPIFVVRDREKTEVPRARFIYSPRHPDWVAIASDGFVLWVSRDGLYNGQEREHVEGCGEITVRPYREGAFVWTVLDVDTCSLPDTQVSFSAALCADFLDRAYVLVPAGLEACYAVLADDAAFDAAFAQLAGAA